MSLAAVILLAAFVILVLVALTIRESWREYMRTGGAAARRHYVYVDSAQDQDGMLSETTPAIVRRREPGS